MRIFLVLLLSYLLGAIPFGYIFTKKVGNKDIRNHGSGNVGATNTARIIGKKYGIIVVLLDIFKGLLAVLLASQLLPETAPTYLIYLAGFVAIIGHDFSIFLKFTGGKGVATTIGVILGISPLVILFSLIIWFIIVSLTKYVSLGSITAALSMPIFAWILNMDNNLILFVLLTGILIVVTHRANIKRLIKGKENKISGSG